MSTLPDRGNAPAHRRRLPARRHAPGPGPAAGAGWGHSRYPVTGTSLDDIVGFVHLRELLLADEPQVTTVAQLRRPILQLPASKPALAALTHMRRDNLQIAIIVDECGGTAGIVEEIVGEIGDEYEQPAQAQRDRPVPTASPPTRGRAPDHRGLREEDRHHPPHGPYETVAGFLLHRLQRLPQLGDTITFDGIRLTVSALDGRRISRVRVTHPTPHTPGTRTEPERP
ncbi:transporter associated domain-containing protein [Rhodococcus opacus]|uniref:transporter associated domain-containing protein n=1 Tax=Rhodococcus opacus TaxID=37919 RepID=UPI00386359E6